MSLENEFEKVGNWLFRKRSYMPLMLVPIIVFAMLASNDYRPAFSIGWEWKALCLFISLAGLTFRSYVVGQVPKGTSGRNTDGQRAETLNTIGIYSMVRHPLYLGNFVILLGIVLWTGLWWLALICFLLFWLYYERIMFAEERYLHKKFGKEFEEWATRTPAIIPSLKHYRPASLKFSLRTVLKREYPGLFNIAASFFILEIFDSLCVAWVREIQDFWLYFFVGAGVISVVLRLLKKRTYWLYEEGR
jgi:protein-S-isoprenylcysteine O-methyltransferase Ste14